MARTHLLAAVALVAALAVPATAGAAQRPADSNRAAVRSAPAKAPAILGSAAAVARRHWSADPCQGQVKLLAGRPVTAGLEPDSDAWVTFDSALGVNDLAAPPSSYANCTITFARWRWPTAASMYEDWDMLCATTVHEIGHLLGHVHDETPGSVMVSVFTDASGVPPLCKKARPDRSGRRPA